MPLSVKASLYVFIDSWKIFLLDDVSDIRFSVDFGNCLRMIGGGCNAYLHKLACYFFLRNGLYTLLSKSNITSRKSTVFKLHCIVTDKPLP